MRAHPLEIDPFSLSMCRPHRQQRRDPEFCGLLDEPIETGALDRRKEQPRPGRDLRLGHSQLVFDRQPHYALPGLFDAAKPFSVGWIEPRNCAAKFEPQDRTKMMRLPPSELDLSARGEAGRDVYTGPAALAHYPILEPSLRSSSDGGRRIIFV